MCRPAIPFAPLLALGLSVPASAQSAPPSLERAHLLQNKSVQDELKITPEQQARFRRIAQDFEQEHGDEIARAKADKDVRKAVEAERKAREALSKAVSDVLRPEQLRRLAQIEFQLRGVWGLLRPDVQKQLGLGDKQKEEIRSLLEALEKGIREVAREAARDEGKRAEAARKIDALHRDNAGKALGRLSEEQRKTWKEMAGEPFELRGEFPRPAR